MDSNHRPRAYQARALTTWATDRSHLVFSGSVPNALHCVCGIFAHPSVWVRQLAADGNLNPDVRSLFLFCHSFLWRTSFQFLTKLEWLRLCPVSIIFQAEPLCGSSWKMVEMMGIWTQMCAVRFCFAIILYGAHPSNFWRNWSGSDCSRIFDKIMCPTLCVGLMILVEMMGIEPMTPCLQGRCSPSWATPPFPPGLGFPSFLLPWSLQTEQQNSIRSIPVSLRIPSPLTDPWKSAVSP